MKRAEAKERILRATVETLAGEGYAGTTARAIALRGGFAPSVIYYHYADLDDLFIATMRFTSGERLNRYRDQTAGLTSAVQVLAALRDLYSEDTAGGHITAVQELIAAGSTRYTEEMRGEVRAWQDLAEEVLGRLLVGTPLAQLVPIRRAAEAAVAFYLGMELLVHLGADLASPDEFFEGAEQAAAMLDAFRGFPEPP